MSNASRQHNDRTVNHQPGGRANGNDPQPTTKHRMRVSNARLQLTTMSEPETLMESSPADTPDADQQPDEPGLKLTDRQIGFALLRAEGIKPREAGKMVGLKSDYCYHLDKKIKRKYDLTNNKLVKGAFNTVKNLSQGLPVGTIERVKDSTALAAAQMIYDRAQPVVKQSMSLNINANVSPVDLSKYRRTVSDDCQGDEGNGT